MAIRLLYLIRHAPVALRGDVPAHEWQLTGEGREAAAKLASAPVWRSLSLLAASTEDKAVQTATPIALAAGLELHTDSRLREVQRGPTPIAGFETYRQTVADYFSSLTGGAPVAGWEPAAKAQQRITSAINGLHAQTTGHLAIVSHGLVLSLYLAALQGMSRPDVAAWASIPSPAVAIVDPDARQVVAPFLSVEAFMEGAGRGAV